ncbi:hypothetical protein EMIT0215P_170101 [Pseudomonas serboccidentalis]
MMQKPVGASLLAIPGINQISNLTPPLPAPHHPCGEGACSRWAAERPQNWRVLSIRQITLCSVTALYASGSKLLATEFSYSGISRGIFL